jgi:hypothetical protein
MSTYADRQSTLDANGARAHHEWVASMSPEEKALAIANGVAEPDFGRHVSRPEGDAVMLAITASPEPNPGEAAAVADDAEVAAAVHPAACAATIAHDEARRATADALASFAARIRSHPNPLMALDALCHCTGLMGIEGLSQADLAKRHNVTRAAFSKLAVQMSDLFDLPPARGMRSRQARNAFRTARLTSLAKQHGTSKPNHQSGT